jgi:hypothetical protein
LGKASILYIIIYVIIFFKFLFWPPKRWGRLVVLKAIKIKAQTHPDLKGVSGRRRGGLETAVEVIFAGRRWRSCLPASGSAADPLTKGIASALIQLKISAIQRVCWAGASLTAGGPPVRS